MNQRMQSVRFKVVERGNAKIPTEPLAENVARAADDANRQIAALTDVPSAAMVSEGCPNFSESGD